MRAQRRSPNPHRALSLILSIAACGCSPSLTGQDCERDLDCRGAGEVCAAGRCVPRGRAGANDALGSSPDANPPDANPPDANPADANLADAAGARPEAGLGPDARATPDQGHATPDAGASADARRPPEDAFLSRPDQSVSTPDASTPGPDASTPGPDASTPGPDANTPSPDAFTPFLDAFVPPLPDAFVPPLPDAFVPPPLDQGLPPDASEPTADAALPPDLGIVLPVDAEVVDARVVPDDGVNCRPERCDAVDNDCDGVIDNGPIAECAAPNADAFCIASGCGPLECRASWFDLNGARPDGCERGCDPAEADTALGVVGVGFDGRPALATVGRQWAAAIVEPTPFVIGHRLTLVRDGRGAPVVLEEGDPGLGTPAVVRTPNGFAVAVRSVADWRHPLRLYWVPDRGPVVEAGLPVNAGSDPALVVSQNVGANGPQLYVAWAGPSDPITGQPTVQWTVGPAENPMALGDVRTTEDLLPPTATPVLYTLRGQPYLAAITDKQGDAHLNTWALGENVGFRVGSTPLEGNPRALSVAVRGDDVLFGLTPELGGEARLHLGVFTDPGIDLTTPGIGVPVLVRAATPGDVAVAATDAGFVVALDVSNMLGETDTEMRFVVDDPRQFALARAGADVTRNASAHMALANAPQGLLAVWTEPSDHGGIYVSGPANCR